MMCIYVPRDLILDKEGWVESLANIMELRANPREQWVGANLFCGLFCKVGNLQAMLVCTGCTAKEKLQKRKIRTRNIEQLKCGCESKSLRQKILKQQSNTGGGKS